MMRQAMRTAAAAAVVLALAGCGVTVKSPASTTTAASPTTAPAEVAQSTTTERQAPPSTAPPASAPTSTTVPTTTAPPRTTTTQPGRCIAVGSDLLDGIAIGLTTDGAGSLSNGWAVKSEDFSNVYMIAAVITAPGMEEVGVWASNSLERGGGIIMAVDGIAQEFSDWPDGDKTDARTSPSDDGVNEARDCAD